MSSSVRFTVTKPEESNKDHAEVHVDANGDNNVGTKEQEALVEEPTHHFALYESDASNLISTTIGKLVNYDGGTIPAGGEEEGGKEKKTTSKLGTVLGVFFPCIQNIFGVLLFIRLVWIVGSAGVLQSFLIAVLCCLCTLTTAISLSAIATNGVVPGGGAYFLISRALGPEFGGAVGILFFLGTSVAASMYIVGAVEIFLQYICPQASLFGDLTNVNNAYNNYRVYGTILLFLLFICVFLGVRFVSKFSPVALCCVLVSIVSIYIGIFTASESNSIQVCFLGDRLLSLDKITEDGKAQCHTNITGPIHQMFCGVNGTKEDPGDPDCEYFFDNKAYWKAAIPGLTSGVIKDNYRERYSLKGNRIGSDEKGEKSRGEIIADVTTTFVILLGIYFPSVTGIMAGSNRSGDLQDPQLSIPRGTILSVAVTSFVYLSCVLFFGLTIEGDVLRDKFGESIGGGLIVARLAWPNEWVILIGSFLSTIGAGLQSLTGAPRLLQAIASDGIIPILEPFSVMSSRGEPFRAVLLTVCIVEVGVAVGAVDYITPIITLFFLMCYMFVNIACVLQSLLKTPNWRPRYRYYHWAHSLFGVAMCLAIMFMTSWYYAIFVMILAGLIYKYIEFKGAEKEWGDGLRGLAMSAARYSLLKLEQGPPHVKNWRPQVLILLKLDTDLQPRYKKMLTFCSQLKAGKGLTLVASVLEGKFADRFAESQAARQNVNRSLLEEKVKGFCEVLVATEAAEGLSHVIQTSGVGGLRHNSVMIGWPYGWRHSEDPTSHKIFIDTLRIILSGHHAVLIPKNVDMFPSNSEKVKGTIDIWWIVHDGGLLMLLPFLLMQHKVWMKCKMRIFSVAQVTDNSIQIKKHLEKFVYQLRLTAEVHVIEMQDNDISAYTYERTLMMEQRTQMLKEIKIKSGPRSKERASIPNDPKMIIEEVETAINVDDTSAPDAGLSSRNSEANLFTFSPTQGQKLRQEMHSLKPVTGNVRRMHTAIHLNEKIVQESHGASLVILNLPNPPKSAAGDLNYMEFLEVLTEGLERVLLVKGGGREVITIYS